ncbi:MULTISPECIES: pyrroline-5-carboxylate reductase [Thalassolituus]|jgi:pyrroline-5-carboxylate reductase|uniref:Pyrroline-5-carboxylate reductase n=1 Tax=Thalassolituus maritimus TaxID=484498 RepID=A0A1N7KA76_9GAMM|nr:MULTISPECIES: pyrroline-5-carboxylate reductase [Thalassolituus]KZZ09573.1 pyrroline-5-carboxylate reductase [Oleibacter sp. HI0075]MEC9254858.1 pyrroline-5-carboxylate reductase [Pseudomonadota bacterium]HCG78268.1 pyrroline-5-carboxylate reductase [Oceanospirillales bacterium]KZZ09701.1 pyrroline-5-carboxylate reductase [Oleibacter sp. HI0075]MEE3161476.1 pyrroline-5-carboxylate reductase [Pseudomonadota bacterium]|tara:strand:- start:6680 stop:7501 length:822 start_codon:yes stop_codon:yes gene_type:complete
MTQIAFIGGGNMATSIIGGLIREGAVSPDLIHVSDPGAEQRERLTRDFGIVTHESNLDAISSATVVILAVKPQMMKAVLEPLQATLNTRQPLLISVAAGISLPTLKEWSGCTAVVRAMPNTPALTGFGATGLFASEEVSLDQRNLTDTLLGATGLAMWVQTEAEIDAVTALSGSGPAYYFLLMESMIDAGIKLGLSEETARRLTLQTALGAGKMASSSDVAPDELRRRVTSPGGTTEQAIATFEGAHLRDIVKAAMDAAARRAAELSDELGNG